MKWDFEQNLPTLSSHDVATGLRALLGRAAFEPNADLPDVLKVREEIVGDYRALCRDPGTRDALSTSPVLRAADDILDAFTWLHMELYTSTKPEHVEQARKRSAMMIRELHSKRLVALSKLDALLADGAKEPPAKPAVAQWSHEPAGYQCPFCAFLSGRDDVNDQRDIVLTTDLATAFVAPRWWPNNRGHVLVIPNAHHENLYDIPQAYGHAVHDAVQRVAVGMRATYGCDGVSTRQHNEPAGYQDVWHYHVHVFPRYEGDQLYASQALPGWVPQAEREPYATKLRDYFTSRS